MSIEKIINYNNEFMLLKADMKEHGSLWLTEKGTISYLRNHQGVQLIIPYDYLIDKFRGYQNEYYSK